MGNDLKTVKKTVLPTFGVNEKDFKCPIKMNLPENEIISKEKDSKYLNLYLEETFEIGKALRNPESESIDENLSHYIRGKQAKSQLAPFTLWISVATYGYYKGRGDIRKIAFFRAFIPFGIAALFNLIVSTDMEFKRRRFLKKLLKTDDLSILTEYQQFVRSYNKSQ